MAKSFAASVGKWASQSTERISAVHKRSIELLADEMRRTKPFGGRVPVDTGNLARSLRAEKGRMPSTEDGSFTSQDVGLAVATLKPGEAIYLGYKAKYARRMNYGFVGSDSLGRVYNQQGNYFVEGAIAEWPSIVNKAVSEIKGTR